MIMDDFQARAIGNLKKRHEDKIRQNAEHIQEYIGYVLARLDSGNVTSVTHHAVGIASDAQEIVIRLAALEAIAEATGILETTEG
jgi:hypothetical protein